MIKYDDITFVYDDRAFGSQPIIIFPNFYRQKQLFYFSDLKHWYFGAGAIIYDKI